MGRKVVSEEAFVEVIKETRKKGSATYAGEQREREGLGLHPLVDPSAYGVIRRSLPRFEEVDGVWILTMGTPMLASTLLDTTGSMGTNVEIALEVLKKAYDLLAAPVGVLKRYDLQVMNAIFGDVRDKYVLKRSQAEMDIKIAEQLTYMNPERQGGDIPEDPQYGLFGEAYLTDAAINRYGLKFYHFTVSDAPGRSRLDSDTLVRVFGSTVFERVVENGYQINRENLPSTKEIVADLLKKANGFFLQVGDAPETTRFWKDIFGTERVVIMSDIHLLPRYQAAIIGLTEGTFDLQTLATIQTRDIQRSVMHIPLNAQAMLPNFNKIPMAGARFAKKGDLWPIEEGAATETAAKTPEKKRPGKKSKPDKKDEDDMWL